MQIATPSEITSAEAEMMISDTQLVLDFHMQRRVTQKRPPASLSAWAEAGPDMTAFMAALHTAMDENPEATLRRAREFIRGQIGLGLERNVRRAGVAP